LVQPPEVKAIFKTFYSRYTKAGYTETFLCLVKQYGTMHLLQSSVTSMRTGIFRLRIAYKPRRLLAGILKMCSLAL